LRFKELWGDLDVDPFGARTESGEANDLDWEKGKKKKNNLGFLRAKTRLKDHDFVQKRESQERQSQSHPRNYTTSGSPNENNTSHLRKGSLCERRNEKTSHRKEKLRVEGKGIGGGKISKARTTPGGG